MSVPLYRALFAAVAASACAVAHGAAFGTFDKAFAADSPWNSRPVSPVLGTNVIPKTPELWFPVVANGSFSTQAFKAVASDGPMTITGVTSAGVWDPDANAYQPSFSIPHWPAAAVGASGSDGHCEVVDTVTGIIYSIWQLRRQADGSFRAQEITWTALDGRGFGDPAHFMQGARSAGVSTLGGLIRANEVNDGDTQYRHALAMSLDKSALSPDPEYVFPATASDIDAWQTDSGAFPMGSLLMLPASFDTSRIVGPQLRKIAETLKTYGAYVVDRNVGTPFAIYVENGVSFRLNPAIPASAWDGADNDEMLNVMRPALRRVMSVSGWVDGGGASFAAYDTKLNLLSGQGPWVLDRSKTQTPVVGPSLAGAADLGLVPSVVYANETGSAYHEVTWARPVKGKLYRVQVTSSANVKGRVVIQDTVTGRPAWDSGWMGTVGRITPARVFPWPTNTFEVFTYIQSPAGGTTASVQFDLRAAP